MEAKHHHTNSIRLLRKLMTEKHQNYRGKAIKFVREGQHPPSKTNEAKFIIGLADDWKMAADLYKKLISLALSIAH